MGNPVVQHDWDHLDLVASDGDPRLIHEGALHRGGVEDPPPRRFRLGQVVRPVVVTQPQPAGGTVADSRRRSSSTASVIKPGLARRQKLVAPLRGPRRRDAQLPRHRLEILTP